ncbi:unnamed protein product [Polarella glacialis]|uniref:Uncharacterized protein n=1 Tax=Polarella glacialis TaxID=89957 RepID=A0A813IG00_POLGL|nr:unnamed protein product [Polarella glacialis]
MTGAEKPSKVSAKDSDKEVDAGKLEEGEVLVVTGKVVEEIKEPEPDPVSPVQNEKAPSVKAPSVKAPSVKAPSVVAVSVTSDEEEEEEEEEDDEEEPQGWGWFAASMAIYMVVIAFGSELFEGPKWHHVPGPGWDFQKPGQDVAKDSATCDSALDGPPCYYGMLNDFQQLYIFLCLPLAPWLVAVALELCAGGRAAWNRKGEALRLYQYALMFVAFYIFHRTKLQLLYELDVTFDPSDVVAVSMVGLAIATKEVGIAAVSMTMASLATMLTAAVVLAGIAYYSFWSCLFFHTPAEVRTGAVVGLLLVVLLKKLFAGLGEEEEEDEDEASETGYIALTA